MSTAASGAGRIGGVRADHDITIRTIDPHNPEDVRQYVDVYNTCVDESDHLPIARLTFEYALMQLGMPGNDITMHLAMLEGEPVAAMHLFKPTEWLPRLEFFVRVRADYQRHGIAQRLTQVALDIARASQRTVIVSRTSTKHLRSDRTIRILRRSGFEESPPQILQSLEIPGAAPAPRPLPFGITTAVYWGLPPRGIMPDLARMSIEAMVEIGHEPDVVLPEIIYARFDYLAHNGSDTALAVALDDSTNTLIGASEIFVGNDLSVASNSETFVDVAWRRRGIGWTLKALALQACRTHRPEITSFETCVPEPSVPMRSLNTQLGYTDNGFLREWRMNVPPPTTPPH